MVSLLAERFDSDKANIIVLYFCGLSSIFFRSLVTSKCLLLCQGHSIHSFAAIQLSCSQETSEKMWNVVEKVSHFFLKYRNTQICTRYFM